MNTKSLFAAAALALIGTTSFAQDVRDYPTPSTLTRAEVKAEMNRAHSEGAVLTQSESYGVVQPTAKIANSQFVAGLSRVEVRRDLSQAPVNAATIVGESYGTVVPGLSLRSRAEVRAEAVAATKRPTDLTQYSGS